MRRAGIVVLIFAFMHSYFGVGSFKNAFGSAPLPGIGRLLAATFALCWAVLFIAAVLLLLRRKGGITTARTAAAGSSLVHLAGLVLTGGPMGPDAHLAVFAWSRALSPLFLYLLLPALGHEDTTHAPTAGNRGAAVIGLAALLPWLAAFAVRPFAGGPMLLPEMKPLLAVFMSIWCALPFAALVAAVPGLPRSRRAPVLLGGLAGTAAASVYVYGLLWLQGFNAFLMALLPPVVFTGAGIGIAAGPAISGKLQGMRSGAPL